MSETTVNTSTQAGAFTHLTPLQRQMLVQKIDQVLPQTQCRRCGYQDCYHYAQAIVEQGEKINRCPPGGTNGIAKLATLTGQAVCEMDESVGVQTPHSLAVIDESWCIGCTKCLRACPVDAIFGAKKKVHVVISQHCTGCELCIPVCPVDCITVKPVQEDNNGQPLRQSIWTTEQSDIFRLRYTAHKERMEQMEKARQARLHPPAQKGQQEEKEDHKAATTAPVEKPHQKEALLNSIMQQARARLAEQPKKQ